MIKVYLMPNGRKYRYNDGDVPQGAIPVVAEQKAAEALNKAQKPENKAVKPANKAKKAATKK